MNCLPAYGPAPRRATTKVRVGDVEMGAGTPIVVQSMTNTDTGDIAGTVEQVAALARAGSEIVRITVNDAPAAAAVPHIRDALDAKGIGVPLVGDFHFNGHRLLAQHPACAEALAKLRINPGNVGRGSKRDEQFATMIVFDQPGTTRDSIYVDFQWEGRPYTLIDTAGVRRRGRVLEAAEKFSVVKTMQAIADANVVVLVLDAAQEISEQDAHIAGFIVEAGRALVVAVNKWEAVDTAERESLKRTLSRKLNFLSFARLHFISALERHGVGGVMKSVDSAYAAAMAKLPTPKLTRALQAAVMQQQPPRAGYGRPKLRYAHQGGSNPPRIIVHGTALEHVPDSYRRYLERFMLVIEGVLPFLVPTLWRDTFRRLTELTDGQIRFIGLTSMLAGLLLLYVVRP